MFTIGCTGISRLRRRMRSDCARDDSREKYGHRERSIKSQALRMTRVVLYRGNSLLQHSHQAHFPSRLCGTSRSLMLSRHLLRGVPGYYQSHLRCSPTSRHAPSPTKNSLMKQIRHRLGACRCSGKRFGSYGRQYRPQDILMLIKHV